MLPRFGDCNASSAARGATATTVLGTARSRDMVTARIPKRRIKPSRAGLLGCGHSDWSRSRSSTARRASFSKRCFSAARSTMVPHCAQVTGALGPGFAVAALKRVPPHCGHLRVSLICVIGLPLRFPFPVSPFPGFRVSPFPAFVSHPRAPKPSPTPLARRQLRHLLELHHLDPLKHDLPHPRPPPHPHPPRPTIALRNHPPPP